jgi:SAM-dependent methyltransferase
MVLKTLSKILIRPFDMIITLTNGITRSLVNHTRLKDYANGEVWDKYSTFIEYLGIDSESRGRLLDIGCGAGFLACYLSRRCPDIEIVGIDTQIDRIDAAKKRANELKLKNVKFIYGSALDIPFEKNYFDYIISTQVFEHFKTDLLKKAFMEVERVLKPGGRFCLNIPGDKFYTSNFWVYRLFGLLPYFKEKSVIKYYKKNKRYPSFELHQHLRPGFAPSEINCYLPINLHCQRYKYSMKFFSGFIFELQTVSKYFKKILYPVSYLFYWLDRFIPTTGYDLTILYMKITDIPKHVSTGMEEINI